MYIYIYNSLPLYVCIFMYNSLFTMIVVIVKRVGGEGHVEGPETKLIAGIKMYKQTMCKCLRVRTMGEVKVFKTRTSAKKAIDKSMQGSSTHVSFLFSIKRRKHEGGFTTSL